MTIPIVQVDAFTAQPFAGNPAAVCILPAAKDVTWMQHVAREMNLAETAFLQRRADGSDFDLRWFTPAVEVDLCGHATLASAHVLWETGQLAATEVARFHTRSGLLTAMRRGDWIDLDFPLMPVTVVDSPPGLSEALGVTPRYVGRSRFDLLVQVESEAIVRDLDPDFRQLATVDARGVIVTSRATSTDCDFVSRFFAPQSGIDEDPVTGSSHCSLAAFWRTELGKDRFVARQLSARGGVLQLQIVGDRVRLGGQAVTVLRGELLA
jgi:predicted PhzF superfamily epimerase YddE/YHI9